MGEQNIPIEFSVTRRTRVGPRMTVVDAQCDRKRALVDHHDIPKNKVKRYM
jgi:hypothetical protein